MFEMDIAGSDPFGSDDAMDALVGGDDPYGVGALPAQAMMLRRASAALPALRAQQAVNQVQVQRANFIDRAPCIVIPIDSVNTIGAGATLAINVTPVSRTRITRLTVSGSLAPNFVITSILAGRVNLFAGAGAIPADMFTADFAGPPFEVPLIEAGTIIQVNVQNITGAATRFIGAFSGIDLTLKLRQG